MEVSGNIKVINPEQQVSPTFKKRELVVTTEETYPQHIIIEFTQDKCDLLNSYAIGDAVKVSINLRGREWQSPQGETKYFNSIQGWRIEKESGATSAPAASTSSAPATPAPIPAALEGEDDLPF
ncbi:Protein of unknown function DUF3127 [Spirosomataceae bacterium]